LFAEAKKRRGKLRSKHGHKENPAINGGAKRLCGFVVQEAFKLAGTDGMLTQ